MQRLKTLMGAAYGASADRGAARKCISTPPPPLTFTNTMVCRFLSVRHYLLALITVCTVCFSSCKYDDTDIWNTINDQADRIAALEEWQQTTNNNLSALQTLINTMDYITSVSPIMQAGDTVGYTINFYQSEPISIYNGSTSEIGITQDTAGNWLWTLDGELLTDANGNPIQANGQSATSPKLSLGKALLDDNIKTDAEGDAIAADIAYLSVDGGKTWYRVTGEKGDKGDKGDTGATGPQGPSGSSGSSGSDGDSFFKDVTVQGNNVIFTLADGTTFMVQKYKGALAFKLGETVLDDLKQPIDLSTGTLTYIPEDAEVKARIIEGEGWSANATDGTITLTGVVGTESLLEVTLLDNGRVVETYQLTVKQSNFNGSGTENSPYLLSSKEELAYLAEQVNSGTSYENDFFQLTGDVDLADVEWTPIGYSQSGAVALGKPFLGTFDGNGKTVSNLSISTTDEKLFVGFFGFNNGTVKNLTIKNATLKGGNSVGALAGYNKGTIENCHVSGTVDISGGSNVGGLVGNNYTQAPYTAVIRQCSVSGNITLSSSNASYAGGLVGYDYEGTIEASNFSGELSGTVGSSGSVGGIVGYTSSGKVMACYSSCKLSNMGTFIGGIAGCNSSGNIVACYSVINAFPNKQCGALIGRNSDGSKEVVTSCYWESKTSGTYPSYGSGYSSADSYDAYTIKVDGSSITWNTAMSAMNTALENTGWQYEVSSDETFPLVIKAAN